MKNEAREIARRDDDVVVVARQQQRERQRRGSCALLLSLLAYSTGAGALLYSAAMLQRDQSCAAGYNERIQLLHSEGRCDNAGEYAGDLSSGNVYGDDPAKRFIYYAFGLVMPAVATSLPPIAINDKWSAASKARSIGTTLIAAGAGLCIWHDLKYSRQRGFATVDQYCAVLADNDCDSDKRHSVGGWTSVDWVPPAVMIGLPIVGPLALCAVDRAIKGAVIALSDPGQACENLANNLCRLFSPSRSSSTHSTSGARAALLESGERSTGGRVQGGVPVNFAGAPY